MSETFRVDADAYFAIVPEWVINADISDRAVRLYAIIARRAGASPIAEASRPWFAGRLRSSISSFDRALRDLERVGAVCRSRQVSEAGDFAATNYIIHRTPCAGGCAHQRPPLPEVGASPVTHRHATRDTTGSSTRDDKVVSPVTHIEEREEERVRPTPDGDPHITTDTHPTTQPDIYQAIVDAVYGPGSTLTTERTKVGKVARDLLNADPAVTPAEVARRSKLWPKLFPPTGGRDRGPTLTATALLAHWDALDRITGADNPDRIGCGQCHGDLIYVTDTGRHIPRRHLNDGDYVIDHAIPCPNCNPRKATA